MKSVFKILLTIFVIFGSLNVFAAAKRVDTTLRVKNYAKKHIVKVKANLPFVAAGFVGAELSTQIGNSPWSAGLYAERSEFGLISKFTGYGFGGTVAYHFNGSPYRDTWYVSSGVYYRYGLATSFFSSDPNFDYSMYNATALLGYQWHWTNFNMSLGFGATAVQAKVSTTIDSFATTAAAAATDYESETISASGAASGAMIEFNLGYSF